VRGLFSGAVSSLRAGRIDQETWDSLEEALIRADVGVSTTTALLDDLRAKVETKQLRGGDDLLEALGNSIRELLHTGGTRALHFDGRTGSPDVWLFVGVNGVGKTTTIGKLARRQTSAGHSVLLAAGDTFRAAAADQLALWAERAGTDIVRGAEGGDPSAIVFDAVQRAAARGNDLVLADTAGRLHTKVNLVEELKKIRRVADRDPGNVTEVLLVLDATTGQNGLAQAREFADADELDRHRADQAGRHRQGRHRHRGAARALRAGQARRPRRGSRRPGRLRPRRLRRRAAGTRLSRTAQPAASVSRRE